MFKHNISNNNPEVPNGMPDSSDPLPLKFFVNPRCPLVPTATKATATEVDQSEAAKEPEMSAPVRDFDEASYISFSFFFFFF